MPDPGDRTDYVPRHAGPHVFPNYPLFTHLVAWACRETSKVAIRDVNGRSESTYTQLLTDVLATRRKIEGFLSEATRTALRNGEEVYIAILAPGGIEFAVAILAVLALGAAAVPITPKQPVDEAFYYVSKSRAVAILASSSAMELGRVLETKAGRSEFRCVGIVDSIFNPPMHPSDFVISSDKRLDSNGAALVIFTSGTTGPPKAVVQRRGLLDDGALYHARQLNITTADTMLHVLPVHHATGVQISFFPFLLSGATIEFRSGSFTPEWIWDRWCTGDITFFSGVPTIYARLMKYYKNTLKNHPEREKYITGARAVQNICGTSALPRPVSEFWTSLLGRKIAQRYGSTECAVPFCMPVGEAAMAVPDGSVGEKAWGVDVKLSPEGEILVKSAFQFAKYLDEPDTTAAAHTDDGYFKTGDIARREGRFYYILGRASVDILKSGGYKISALDIEREVMALPYVREVMVVGVPDEEFGQRVAAVVCVEPGVLDRVEGLTLAVLRRDLESRLAGYKRPTLLRVVDGALPRTASGKVMKKALAQVYFPPGYTSIPGVQMWHRQQPAAKL